jgi:uncharacterized protein (DUF2252 family)
MVGRAHGRQMDETTRSNWRAEVTKGGGQAEGTPSWLWSNVVELSGRHEVGYLQHCPCTRTRKPPDAGLATC